MTPIGETPPTTTDANRDAADAPPHRRLVVIGTSHVAAFKDGWARIAAQHPDWRVDFFAATAPNFPKLRLNEKLRFGLPKPLFKSEPQTLRAIRAINGRAGIDLSTADVVLWVGFSRLLDDIVSFVEASDVEGLIASDGRPTVPRAEFDAFCDDLAARRSPPQAFLDRDRPSLVLHGVPNPSDAILAAADPAFAAWTALAARPGGRAAMEAFLDRYEAHLEGLGVRLLRQPAATLLGSGLTPARYSIRSRRLRGGAEHPDTDHSHMNAQYGEQALAALFEMLGPAPLHTAPPQIETRVDARTPPRPASAPTLAPAAPAQASPYADLPPRAFWRSGVAERAPLDPGDLYRARIVVNREMRVVTAGSCFAQVVGRALRDAGFKVVDAEPFPDAVPDDVARRFGYRIFSARYGNIYTARQLAQLFDEAEGDFSPALPVWRRDGRYFDAQRPNVEPDGLATEGLVLRHRVAHLAAVRRAMREADLFVFTFGLTEAWIHTATGTVYPTAPGTIAGDFDPAVFSLRNFDAIELLADFERFRAKLKTVNPSVRFLVTTSPVPMTATASGEHIEVANCYSKSTLRAVCGMLTARHADIDYFPGYEIITSQNARGAYYGPNQRNVSAQGVAAAMRLFMDAHAAAVGPTATAATRVKRVRRRARRAAAAQASSTDPADVVCEEILLESFAR